MLEEFQRDIGTYSNSEMINKYYLSGSSTILSDGILFALRQEISTFFRVEFQEVFLVGSAKLGFSIKSAKRYEPFGDESDIDIVIVSSGLFDEIWQEVYKYDRDGGYWPGMRKFKEYHFKGWMRPDKLPNAASFKRSKEWWDFFESLSGGLNYGPYKIRGGLYRTRFFFENYQGICLDQCRDALL